MHHGLVVKEQSGFFWVETQDGAVIMCRLRGRLMEAAQSADIAAIGDRVTITISEIEPNTGTIEEVAERQSVISRAARTEGNRGAGAAEREQVIIANADQAFFIFAAASPSPNTKALDRFLVMGEKAQLERIVIVVNKIDLTEDDDRAVKKQFEPYERMGYTVLHTSALEGVGVEKVRELLTDKISVFSGPSGVGKTSLLNCIQPGLGRAVKAVSQRSREGMHTTRDSELIKLEQGGYVADTPGIRTLTIWDVEPEELDGYFREIAELVGECRFADCKHENDPGCAVRAAVERGEIAPARYKSYLHLRAEIEEAYALN